MGDYEKRASEKKAVIKEYFETLTATQIEHVREVAKHDLFFLSNGVLGYPDVNLRTHGDFCRFIELDPATRRLGLMPRSHLKSTIATVADSIRLTLLDPADSSILIANEVDGTATAFMDEIKQHFEKNEALRMLFPELIHRRFQGPGIKWSSELATLPVEGRIKKDPHWMPAGVGASITGRHFTRVKADDLIGFEARYSPAAMERAIKWAKNLTALLVSPQDTIDYIGTRWMPADLYNALMQFYGDQLVVFTRSCHEGNEPIFPEKFTMEFFDQLRESDPDQYYAQYENNPIEGGQRDFPSSSVRDYWWDSKGRIEYQEKGSYSHWRLEELDRTLQADPAGDKTNAVRSSTKKNDLAAIVVTGVSPKDQLFSLDAWSARTDPTTFVDKIFEMACRWNVRVVAIEQVSLATTLHYFEKKMREERRYFRVEALRPKNKVKTDRIRTIIDPIIRTHRLFVPKHQRTLRSQLDFFPNIKEDGEIDCLTYHAEVARRGMTAEEEESRNDAVEKILAMRNQLTGY